MTLVMGNYFTVNLYRKVKPRGNCDILPKLDTLTTSLSVASNYFPIAHKRVNNWLYWGGDRVRTTWAAGESQRSLGWGGCRPCTLGWYYKHLVTSVIVGQQLWASDTGPRQEMRHWIGRWRHPVTVELKHVRAATPSCTLLLSKSVITQIATLVLDHLRHSFHSSFPQKLSTLSHGAPEHQVYCMCRVNDGSGISLWLLTELGMDASG